MGQMKEVALALFYNGSFSLKLTASCNKMNLAKVAVKRLIGTQKGIRTKHNGTCMFSSADKNNNL